MSEDLADEAVDRQREPSEVPPSAETAKRALVVMHVTTTMGRAGQKVWTTVDEQLAKRAANGLLTVLQVEDDDGG
jgi:hypothetical protein